MPKTAPFTTWSPNPRPSREGEWTWHNLESSSAGVWEFARNSTGTNPVPGTRSWRLHRNPLARHVERQFPGSYTRNGKCTATRVTAQPAAATANPHRAHLAPQGTLGEEAGSTELAVAGRRLPSGVPWDSRTPLDAARRNREIRLRIMRLPSHRGRGRFRTQERRRASLGLAR